MAQEQFDALRDQLVKVVNERTDQITGYVNQRVNDLAGWTRDDAKTLQSMVSATPTAILNQTIKLTDGSVATVASVLANIQSKPSAPAVAPTVAVDVNALATALAPLLAVNQVEQFVTEIRNLKFAAQ